MYFVYCFIIDCREPFVIHDFVSPIKNRAFAHQVFKEKIGELVHKNTSRHLIHRGKTLFSVCNNGQDIEIPDAQSKQTEDTMCMYVCETHTHTRIISNSLRETLPQNSLIVSPSVHVRNSLFLPGRKLALDQICLPPHQQYVSETWVREGCSTAYETLMFTHTLGDVK